MKFFPLFVFLQIMLFTPPGTAQLLKKPKSYFNWTTLPPLPDEFGFAGAFAGVANGALIVAGGANFPDGGAPWTGAKKVWTDKIFVLEKPDGPWKLAGHLPQALGYGVSITWKDRFICLGGSNAEGHFSTAFSVSYAGNEIQIEKLPDLPQPLANTSGAVVGDVVYLAGGLFTPESTTTAGVFWSLDLSAPAAKRAWQVLETWPGPPRMLAVAGVQQGSFLLFSGTDLQTAPGGGATRTYLRDAYRFTPHKGWDKLADLPHAVVAAPSPAYPAGTSEVMIFGGDDGKLAPQASALKEKHPGFSDEILRYDLNQDKWFSAGKIKTDKKKDAATNPNGSRWAPVTTTSVLWQGKVILPSGEVRPAVRTPNVLMACPAL